MILITGGGTGGHLKIAKVIKDELKKRDIKTIYIGSTTGADKEWFEKSDFDEKFFFTSSGVVNKKGLNKISSFAHILKLSLKAKEIIKSNNIKAVFSVGGYSAAPASFGAILSNTPLFIHEQNASIGTLNRVLKPFSKRFFSTFLNNDPYPIEEIFFKTKRIRENLKTIIFLGGSQGAMAINELALKVAPRLHKEGINIIHQTGKIHFKKIKEFYEKNNIKADVFDFDKNLAKKIAMADFAVSRAGASTLFELVANNLPTLFIPYPYAANDHQYYNAKWVEERNGGFVRREIKEDEFFKLIEKLDLKELSTNLSKIELKNGAKFIVDEMLKEIDVLSV